MAVRANGRFQKNGAAKTVLPTGMSHEDGTSHGGNGSSRISEKKGSSHQHFKQKPNYKLCKSGTVTM